MQPTSWAGRDSEATSRSNVYEINQWLWQFGRGKQRLGFLLVAETEERRLAVAKDGAKRAVATRAVATRAEVVAKLSRRQVPRADWNRPSIEYPWYKYL